MAHCADTTPHSPHRWLKGNISWTKCNGKEVELAEEHGCKCTCPGNTRGMYCKEGYASYLNRPTINGT